jgi:hypothetical protein
MGTWGTGILDDDLARDVYDAYVAAAEQGKTPTAIVRALRRTHASELTDPAQDAVFWLALAHAQRDVGALDRGVHNRVEHIVRTQVGLEPWLEIGAVEAGRRKAVLTRFLASLSRPGPSKQPSKRCAKAANEAIDFEVGDCLSIALEDGRFAAAIVTRDKRASTAPSHILTLVDASGPAPPLATVFDPPRWLVLAPVEFPGLAVKLEVYAEGLARHRARYRVITRIALDTVPEPLVLRVATWATLWRVAASALELRTGRP